MPKVTTSISFQSVILSIALLLISFSVIAENPQFRGQHKHDRFFNRIASFPVYLNTDISQESVSEIVDVSQDGNTLIYTDGVGGRLGFVDIRNPESPKPLESIEVGGEPTSVAVAGRYALATVNTSSGFDNPSGMLRIIAVNRRQVIGSFDLGGQPDAVAVSPDGKYAAIVIENERDEDFQGGALPQGPSGFLVIVDFRGEPEQWRLRKVQLAGIPDLYADDAEPEYVDINEQNIAVVTFQENNYLALIDLPSGKIINHFSAGKVDLFNIDTQEEKPSLINLTGQQLQRAREPDGVAWLTDSLFVTANEGDLDGGSRDFTVFDRSGQVLFSAGNALDHQAVRLGHYPDGRSGNKGNEPETVDVGHYGNNTFLFAASERANVIFVYKVNENQRSFELLQTLPAGIAPEGIKAIPARNLLVATSEIDRREDGIRSVLTLYRLQHKPPAYPTVMSTERDDGAPIPWSALSGLSMDLFDENVAYAIHDGYFQRSRIYQLYTGRRPAIITAEILLSDSQSKLAAIEPGLVNVDGTVNLDAEGVSSSAKGGFWIASEGAGTVGDADRPFENHNLLLHVTQLGDIDEVVKLPDATSEKQSRYGLEGVASVGAGDNEVLFVAFQREWQNDPAGYVRIGRYDRSSTEWSFYYYPLDNPESPNGGWVGLSEITALGDNEFAVIERDNQGNTDARIKRIYKFSVADLIARSESQAPSFALVEKTLLKDLLPVMGSTGGMVLEKIEGMAVTESGDLLIVNDNDGVDVSNGETQLLRVTGIIQ